MNREIVAIFFHEGGKFISELLRLRAPKIKATSQYTLEVSPPAEPREMEEPPESKVTSIKAGCVPCAIGHVGTCTGLLSEGMRFARSEGIESPEVIDRVTKCLQELNTMERVDLTEEKIVQLPPREKEIAIQALQTSRNIRHGLEGLTTANDLEALTAETQTASKEIAREWFKERLAKMNPDEKKALKERVELKIKEQEGKVNAPKTEAREVQNT